MGRNVIEIREFVLMENFQKVETAHKTETAKYVIFL